MTRHHVHHAPGRERPAGSESVTLSSAGAAYDPIIGASQVQSGYNVNGTGMTVAVIDTGIDTNNPALGGFGSGAKVVAGFDFSNPTNPNPANATNANSVSSPHGTGVAGLIASNSPADPGVAPGADLVDLKVTDASGTASLQSIANALQWVVNNHTQYNISVVNMSLSDGSNYTQNWFATAGGAAERITNLIGQLRAMNIPVVVATGNNFDGLQGEGFAAIVQGTISVTATDLNNQLLPEAQRLGASVGGGSATVMAAPGDGITAPYGDGGTATVDGTSFSTALVSGSVVLLQQIYQQRFGALPTVDQLQQWLQDGATTVNDPVTGLSFDQLHLPGASARIPSAPAPVVSTPQPAATIRVSTATVIPNVVATPSVAIAAAPAPTPAPAPAPAPTPAPAPAQPPARPTPPTPAAAPTPPAQPAPDPAPVLGGSTVSNASSVPQPITGLARLLQTMVIYQASSVRQD